MEGGQSAENDDFFKKILPFRNSWQNGHKNLAKNFLKFFFKSKKNFNIFELSYDIIEGGQSAENDDFFIKNTPIS